MLFDLVGAIPATHRRWTGATKNGHGQLTNGYQDEQVQVGVDDLLSRELAAGAEPGSVGRSATQGMLFLPPGTTVDQRDLFVIQGNTYKVVHTAPVPQQSMLTGLVFRTEVRVERTTG